MKTTQTTTGQRESAAVAAVRRALLMSGTSQRDLEDMSEGEGLSCKEIVEILQENGASKSLTSSQVAHYITYYV